MNLFLSASRQKGETRKAHCIGIAGVGMSALAQLLRAEGMAVTGSDVSEEFHTNAVLERLHIPVLPFSQENITPDLSAVYYSSAYGKDHIERRAAERLRIPTRSYGEAIGAMFSKHEGILIAGTHGKTTTTALVGHILALAGKDPTVVVGGVVQEWKSNVRVGHAQLMALEGDEYQEKFLYAHPQTLIISSLDYDHADYFPDKESYAEAFRKLVQNIKEGGVLITHSSIIQTIGNAALENAKKIRVLALEGERESAILRRAKSSLLGEHNRRNMRLVIRLALERGISEETILSALETFKGVARRMEFYTKQDARVIIMDDYAHHPVEISATLAAVRGRFPAYRVTAVFHPHTYSRTAALLNEFASALRAADRVLVLDIYASQREAKGTVKSEDLVSLLQKTKNEAWHTPTVADAEKFLDESLRKSLGREIVLTLGAGNVWEVARTLARNSY